MPNTFLPAVMRGISTIDLAVICIYLVGITALGCYAGLRKKKAGTEAKEYFLAGGHLGWFMIGLSLFATNISCYHLIGLAQNGFDSGLVYGNFEWMAAFILVLLALFFAPFYLRSKVATLPDFLEKRYCRASRDWLAGVSIVSSIVIHITFSFVAGGAVLHSLFGFDIWTCILVIAALTGLYTIVGGLTAVVWTETIQTVVLLGGAVAMTVACFAKAGGWEPVAEVIRESGETQRMSMLRPHGDPDGMPWYSILLGYPVLGIWYWCADQTIVQRVLGARSENHARVGPLFAGLIKILPVFLFVVPGLIAWALWKKGLLDLSAITDAGGKVNSKELYTQMITQLLPPGVVGILVAALMAGLMSNVAASLNSISTLASFDLYKRFKPQASEASVLWVGRFSAAIALIVGIATVWPASRYGSIFAGLNDVISHIAPPITCVFVFGVFWGRASSIASKWTLWLGSTLGAVVFASNKLLPSDSGSAVIEGFLAIPFMMMAFYLFCICSVIMVSLSFAYPHRHTEESKTLYWKNPMEPLRQKGWPGLGDYRVLASLLIAIMAVLYWIFR